MQKWNSFTSININLFRSVWHGRKILRRRFPHLQEWLLQGLRSSQPAARARTHTYALSHSLYRRTRSRRPSVDCNLQIIIINWGGARARKSRRFVTVSGRGGCPGGAQMGGWVDGRVSLWLRCLPLLHWSSGAPPFSSNAQEIFPLKKVAESGSETDKNQNVIFLLATFLWPPWQRGINYASASRAVSPSSYHLSCTSTSWLAWWK